MTRSRGNAIVKFIMIIAVAAIIFLALDFWLGTQKDAEEVASGPVPIAETAGGAEATAEDQAASKAADAARAAVASGMTLEEARELGRRIGAEVGTEIGTEVGTETARSLLEEKLGADEDMVADGSDGMATESATEPAPTAAPDEPAMVAEAEAEPVTEPEAEAEPEATPEPEPVTEAEVEAEPAPVEVANVAPAAPVVKPRPAPVPSKFWWTSSWLDGGLGIRFVGPYKDGDSGIAVLFTGNVDASSLDKFSATKGGKAVTADWKVSDKNAEMVYASGLEAGTYQVRVASGVKGTDGKSLKRTASGSVSVK